MKFLGTLALVLVACSCNPPPRSPQPRQGETPRMGTGDSVVGVAAVRRPVIYQMVVRTFGNINPTRATDGTIEQNGVGKFDDINVGAIESLRGLGVTHIWLTGVLRQATLTDYSSLGLPADDPDATKGRAGSFYAVRDYFDVCPDYANNPSERLAEFDALVQRIHDQGMAVLIDLVPNHVARGYASVVHPEFDFGINDDATQFYAPHNSYYYLNPTQALSLTHPASWQPSGVIFDGRIASEDGSAAARTAKVTGNDVTSASPGEGDWYETIKLNYGRDFTTGVSNFTPQPTTWTGVNRIIAYWQARGVDGFRCDFATLVPGEAWSYLIRSARERAPHAYFFAEAYADQQMLLDAGFDSVYHASGYEALKHIYHGTGDRSAFAATYEGIATPERYVRYLENHDERRIASPIDTAAGTHNSGFGSAAAAYQLAPIVYLTSSAPILIFNGQEVGEPGAGVEGFGGEDGRTSIFDYWSMPQMVKWVGDHSYDGVGLDSEGRKLRQWYGELLALSHGAAAMGSAYVNLGAINAGEASYASHIFGFARYEPGSGEVMLVVSNFAPGAATSTHVRLPPEVLTELTGEQVKLTLVLDRRGRQDLTTTHSLSEMSGRGFSVTVQNQSAHVYMLR